MKKLLFALLMCVPVAGWGATIGVTTYFSDTAVGGAHANWAYATEITMPEDGQITKLTARIKSSGATAHGKAVIWTISAHAPGTVVATGQACEYTSTPAWVDFTFSSPVSVTNGTHYAIGIVVDGNTSIMQDYKETGIYYREADTGNSYTTPETWGGSNLAIASWAEAIYATYTTGGGETPPAYPRILIFQ